MAYTTIDNPELYFQAKAYSGDGSAQSITLDGSEDMAINLYWGKRRNSSAEHEIYDTVRGVTKYISSNDNDVEQTNTNGLSAFGSNGFTLAGNSSINNGSIVAWCWVESATPGFDIVTATGNATAKTISHSLSAVPHVIFSKEKSGSVNDWVVYHHRNTSAPETDNLILNENNATSDYPYWNDTTPTSSVFSVGTGSVVNRSGSTYVYYLWSEKQGFSKFGSYTGNGNADGPFIYTGFKPAFVMIKKSSGTSQWYIWDNKRNTSNPGSGALFTDLSNAEETDAYVDFFSNGFKIQETSSDFNESGGTKIYMAFAEAPFVNSNGVPCNAR